MHLWTSHITSNTEDTGLPFHRELIYNQTEHLCKTIFPKIHYVLCFVFGFFNINPYKSIGVLSVQE